MAQEIIIGMDAKRLVRNSTGLGNYGRTLVNDLVAASSDDWHFRLYAPDEGRSDLRAKVSSSPRIAWTYPEASLSFQRSLWRIGKGIIRDMQRDGVRLFHGLTGELPRGLKASGIKSVVTIHDLIFLRHPEYYHWLDAKIYAWKFRYTCREADRIIAISERTKQDVMELGGVPEEKIEVVYQSCAPKFKALLQEEVLQQVRQKYRLPQRFLLSVGTIERRKNLMLAVKALDLLPADVHLVAVGRQTDYVKEFPKNSRIHFLNGVSDEELAALYQLAEVFVYPSRYEGFGIPIIEAIHSGLPVVACTGSCLEEAGGPDNLYVGPDAVEDFSNAVRQVLAGAEGREERVRRSQAYVRRFEGHDVAGQVMHIYQDLLGSR